ncbi:hypothetical protein Tco_0491960, partial [Tanacetum coccineum]
LYRCKTKDLQAPSTEEIEPFETDESAATPPPHPTYCVTARISIPAPVPTPVWSDAEIPSPSLPPSPPSPVLSPAPPPSPIRSLGYQAGMIRMRAEAASTSHSLPLPPPFILSPTRPDAPSLGILPPLPILVPTSSPPLLLPSASRREDIPEMETEARLSREAWRRLMDASDLARGEVMSLRTTVLGQMSEIRELHASDRRRQAMISEMLKADQRRSTEMRELRTADHTRQQQLIQTLTVMQSLQGQVTTLQGQVTTLQGQVTALQGQQGPVGGPAQPELPEEAGSSS